jgi:PAS domain S-box-containing protein
MMDNSVHVKSRAVRPSRVSAQQKSLEKPAPAPAKVTHWLEQPVLEALVSQGTQVACVLHHSLGCLYMTPNWHSQFGHTVASAMGPTFWSFVHDTHRERLQQAIKSYASGKSQSDSVKLQVKTKHGKWRWAEMQFLKTMRDENLPEKQVLCILRDITSEMQIQSRLQKTCLENELALNARSEFMAHLSHELRTPLNAILGFTQMIENKVYGKLGNPKYDEYIRNIQQSGTTLLSKLNDLFEIAHIDAGYAEINDEAIDVASLLKEVVEIHSHKAFEHQVKIKIKALKQPIMVHADRIMMLKVMINLLSNAIKFNKAGGEVFINAEITPERHLAITFSDTGHGLGEVQLGKIKDAIAHEEGFVGRDRNHIGLGLALAVELVKLHKGVIEVESEAGVGSHFAIVLPESRVIVKKSNKKTILVA